MTAISVVQADLADPRHQDAVVLLVNAYARDPMGIGRDLPDEVRAALLPGLQAHPTTVIFLAYEGEQPVGIAVCFLGFSTFAARPLLNVHDLAVLPDHRGRGVGRRLLDAVEAHARARGCVRITLEVLDTNRRAQRLYRACGFTGFGNVDGTGRTWFLQKRLEGPPVASAP